MVIEQATGIDKIRKDFVILNKLINGKRLVYLDSSATTLTPKIVIESMDFFYENFKSSVHRGIHNLSEEATSKYEESRGVVSDFINSEINEIIFTGGTTESLNLIAYSLRNQIKEGDEIVLTEMEHHSNLVPWQQIAREKGAVLKFIKVINGEIDYGHAIELINRKTKVVSVIHASNILGTVNDVKKIGKIAHDNQAIFVVDGAQSVSSMKIDVMDLNCDFFAFSGHKIYGPTGIGVLYGRMELLEKIDPFMYGGGMINNVDYNESSWNQIPWKFEAGSPKIAEAIGLASAIKYVQNYGIENIKEYCDSLYEYAKVELNKVEGIKIYGPPEGVNKLPIISFSLGKIHPHDISEFLDRYGVAVRGGHMCAEPFVKKILGVDGVTRATFSIYNIKEDVDIFVNAVSNASEEFLR